MTTYNEEYIGFETMLPSEAIDLLTFPKENSDDFSSLGIPELDEHELAMVTMI